MYDINKITDPLIRSIVQDDLTIFNNTSSDDARFIKAFTLQGYLHTPLSLACAVNATRTLNRLLGKKADAYEFPAVINNIAAESNLALRRTAQNGHIEALERLLAKTADGSYGFSDVIANIAVRDNMALRWASENGHHKVIEPLLPFEAVFSYAEMHEHEYGAYVAPFVTEYTDVLVQRKQQANFSFSQQEASYAYFVLRYLIRTPEPIESLDHFLSIPSVLALVTRNDNELLQLAMRVSNQSACTRLMQIDAVRTLARTNNFYTNQGAIGINLRALAENAESSMVAFSPAENEQYENVQNRYQVAVTQMGVDKVIDDFKDYLIGEFKNAPPSISSGNTKISLPFTWDELQALRSQKCWDNTTYNKALIAYYEHSSHTAFRYLSKPNPWMASDASYMVVYEPSPQLRYAWFEGYEPMIALFWIAAKDKDEPEQEGCDYNKRMSLFTEQLAKINRQHNWDKYRVNIQTQQREEYDDLTGDKPSCYSGMKRGIFLALNFHNAKSNTMYIPEIAIEDSVRGCVREFYRDTFALMRPRQISLFINELKNYFETLENPPEISNISKEVIADLKLTLSEKYPHAKVSGYRDIDAYLTKIFDASRYKNSHFLKFYQEFNLDSLLNDCSQAQGRRRARVS